jgi:HTH-type transcriptional regulator / antitoxin HigA
MRSQNLNKYSPESIPPPGDTILDYLDSYGWTQKELALRTDLTPKTISEICSGKAPISPTTALALEKVFQRPAHFWLSLQSLFDEFLARSAVAKKAVSWSDWLSKFPIKEMQRCKYFEELEGTENDVSRLLEFFGVSSPVGWNSIWKTTNVAFRQTSKFDRSEEAMSAWVRATEVFANRLESEIEVRDFNSRQLKELIPEIRRQTLKKVDKAVPNVQDLCATVGIIFVLVPELSKTGISGCTRWLSETKVIVALTLRHKRDDIFWFTFFHELGHVLLHKKACRFVLDNAAESLNDKIVDLPMASLEEEANRFAADTLIDPDALFEFIKMGDYSPEALEKFARKQEIAPGIVVGQLQHLGVIQRNQGNMFKQTLDWAF